MARIWRENSLSITMFALFLFAVAGQSVAGRQTFNDERRAHGQPTVGYFEYLASGHFVEAVFENWESEFLQMGLYVLLTAYLVQKGSPESRKLGEDSPQDDEPETSRGDPKAPWPVRRGGVVSRLYEHSLATALLALFVLSFALHAAGGAAEYSRQQAAHGEESVSALDYLATSQFWFESLQNWQSEFLSIVALAVLAIFLRQKGSPESKPVAAPNSKTGQD